MIHYHGTPVSGPSQNKSRFLRGRHALVSFAYPVDLPVVAEVCQSFVLDNGAFTAWKGGEKIDELGYYAWVDTWHKHPGFDWALIPDVIDGGEKENDEMLLRWPQSLSHVGVPIWHVHEGVSRLQRLCDQYSTVALGSSGEYKNPGSAIWWTRMKHVMGVICDKHGHPPARLHGLRMLAPKVFRRLPLASADSTNASVNAGSKGRFGMYTPVDAWQRAEVIAGRIEQFNSAPAFDPNFVPLDDISED